MTEKTYSIFEVNNKRNRKYDSKRQSSYFML